MRMYMILIVCLCGLIAAGDDMAMSVDIVSVDPITVTTPDSAAEAYRTKVAQLSRLSRTPINTLLGDRLDSTAIDEWLEIYENDAEYSIKGAPLISGIRMIAELRSKDYADVNLAYYSGIGYNAALITITSDADSPESLAELAQCIIAAGMQPWLAWSGPEKESAPVYRSVARIRQQFAAVLPLCRGFIPAWRRTSVHLFAQDDIYARTLCRLALEVNPDLKIVSEIYRGERLDIRRNSIQGASGCYISGVGFLSCRVEELLPRVFGRDMAASQCLGLVIGHSGYYASRKSQGLTWQQALDAKIAVEQAFLRGGCCGTITIHGDASDEGTSVQATDDIGKYPIKNGGEK